MVDMIQTPTEFRGPLKSRIRELEVERDRLRAENERLSAGIKSRDLAWAALAETAKRHNCPGTPEKGHCTVSYILTRDGLAAEEIGTGFLKIMETIKAERDRFQLAVTLLRMALATCVQELSDQQAMPDDSNDAYYASALASTADYDLLDKLARLRAENDAAEKRAEGWREYAMSLRCPQCSHERGAISRPAEKEDYKPIWVCPCDCHADVADLRAENDRLRAALQPFSKYARLMNGFGPSFPDDAPCEPVPIPVPVGRVARVTIGDCRAARDALAGQEGK